MSLYESIRNNFWIKIFALVLAILIYLAVQSILLDNPSLIWNPLKSGETKEFPAIPVRLVIDPDQGQGFKVDPPFVKIVVSGEPQVLNKLLPSKLLVYARVDIAKAPLGSFPVEIVPIKELTIDSIQPPRVDIETVPTSVMLFPGPPPIAPAPVASATNANSKPKDSGSITNEAASSPN